MPPPQPPGSSSASIPELDGLRGVSILLVLLSHAGLGRIVPGGFGVTLFFGISGFIITRLLLAEWQARGRIGLGAFYLRRVLRLSPVLLGFAASALLLMGALGVPPGLGETLSALFYGANYWRIWQGHESGIATLPSPFGVLWSLSIEEHFYLVFPLFLALALRRGGFLPVVLAAILASLGWRLALRAGCAPGGGWERMRALCGQDLSDRLYVGTDTRLDALLFGCLLAWLAAHPPTRWVTALLRHPGSLALGLALVLGSLLYRDPAFRDTWRYSVQSLAILLGLGALLFSPGLGAARALLRHPALLLLGRLSYTLYLTHWLAVMLACFLTGQPLREGPYPPDWYGAFIPLTLLLTAAFYWGLERPAARLRRRLRLPGAAGRGRGEGEAQGQDGPARRGLAS